MNRTLDMVVDLIDIKAVSSVDDVLQEAYKESDCQKRAEVIDRYVKVFEKRKGFLKELTYLLESDIEKLNGVLNSID